MAPPAHQGHGTAERPVSSARVASAAPYGVEPAANAIEPVRNAVARHGSLNRSRMGASAVLAA